MISYGYWVFTNTLTNTVGYVSLRWELQEVNVLFVLPDFNKNFFGRGNKFMDYSIY